MSATSSQMQAPRTESRPGAPSPRAQRVSRRRLPSWLSEQRLIGVGAVVLALVVWEVAALLRLKPKLTLPGPFDVIDAFKSLFEAGDIWVDLWTSAQELLIGLGLAVVIGLPLGLLIGWYKRAAWALNPFINFLYATPRIALTPLLIIWLGIGSSSKIAIVFLMAFFPVIINTAQGVQSLEQGAVRVARCFGASDLQLFRTVALPGTVPFVASGIRLAVGQALIGVFVAELSGAQHGVGLMMSTAGQQFQTATVFAGLFIFAAAGIGLTSLLRRVENHFAAWRPSHD
ncbi:ABC transporter permease [Streptomyces carpinensis]|uniref:ABC transporter permease n=1 Tax=Streptomyces carpinensis TaxID=66369 RepID=A0ABV1VUG1_9ACTN|nr:ABC transporter permease [Streptomyces carpinensis]